MSALSSSLPSSSPQSKNPRKRSTSTMLTDNHDTSDTTMTVTAPAANKKQKTGAPATVHPFFSTPQISYTAATDPSSHAHFTHTAVADSLHILTYKNPAASPNIAAFDLDKTLITPKHGAKFPRHKDDWHVLFAGTAIHDKLRATVANGFKLVVFTNQAGINGSQAKLDEFLHKARNVALHFNVPMQFFIATKKDIFRKPAPGMWDQLVHHFNLDPLSGKPITINVATSFFVGDAAGRPHAWKRGAKKDFADTDRKFALNAGIAFHTPEEFFLDHEVAPHELDAKAAGAIGTLKTLLERDEAVSLDLHATIRPIVQDKGLAEREMQAAVARRVAENQALAESDVPVEDDEVAVVQDVIVLCGTPASGKSTIAGWLRDECGYEVVNQDTLGSFNACVSTCKKALASGKSVVIDNTNPMLKTRKVYLELAREVGARARLVRLLTPVELAVQLDLFRSLTTNRSRLPPVAFSTFTSRFEEPSHDEGFHELIAVPFVPKFTDPGHRRLVTMWLS
ncbi:polynucleotide kinase 3 phosphatase-domain-containing protein [Catenaria anguillulae PL171]|uniref:Polynucleotide kinase 3 phosphatase-domain-containing protein n=1 Tax=Catenaria anguillulae PL171 TaxID=765915 RepID=A0A1Y2HUA4_9FUNG|nr:polynucleotide kinase 3 phosphatase-domain-containing protein [Catenaria anguillulae PL171]